MYLAYTVTLARAYLPIFSSPIACQKFPLPKLQYIATQMVSCYKYFQLCYRCCGLFWNNVLLHRSGTRTECRISWIWSQCHWTHDHSSACGEIYCNWILFPKVHKYCECLENHHIASTCLYSKICTQLLYIYSLREHCYRTLLAHATFIISLLDCFILALNNTS